MKKWKLLKETDASPAKWYPIVKRDYELPNGKVLDYYTAKLNNSVFVLPIVKGECIFVKQFRPGSQTTEIQVMAGYVENEEEVEKSARRELLEETGMTFKTFLPLGSHYRSPANNIQKIYTFLACDFEKQEEQILEETEFIEVVKIPVKKVVKMLKNDEFNCADTKNTILMAYLKYPEKFK